MHTGQQILLLGKPSERLTRIGCILEFLGEQIQFASVEQLQDDACPKGNALLVLESAGMSVANTQALVERFANHGFILLEQQNKVNGSNIIAHLLEPYDQQQLTKLLSSCRKFTQSKLTSKAEVPKPANNSKPANNQTKLFRSLVGCSNGIKQVRKLITQVASTEATVLVLGQSGTGKEIVARNIHYLSKRSGGPFIPVNCGAIPPELLESELFGHEKGAFTGAISTRKGRFELAQGGTLFLDEIGDMPLQMQVKMLRILQERRFERVGGSRSINADVRVVAATHRNLEQMIAENQFREDLYYRLHVFPIEMPPLNERREDIPLLLQELIKRLSHEGHGRITLTQGAIKSLKAHCWSGNVRELANLVERLNILYPDGVVDTQQLPAKYLYYDSLKSESIEDEAALERDALASLFDEQSDDFQESSQESGDVLNEQIDAEDESIGFANELPEEGVNLKDLLAELETDMIRQALTRQDYVVARAAEMLGIRRTTLVEKMRKYGMSKALS